MVTHLECAYTALTRRPLPLYATERKMVLPNDTFVSEMRFLNGAHQRRKLNILFWTMRMYSDQRLPGNVHGVMADERSMSFESIFKITDGPEVSAVTVMGMDRPAKSYLVQLSQSGPFQPFWIYTPFFDRFRKGGLPNEVNVTGVRNRGILYLGQHVELELAPQEEKSIRFCSAVAPTLERATQSFYESSDTALDPLETSRKNWRSWFNSVPYFECSDEYVEKYYWYRWYGLRLLTTFGGIPEQPYRSVNEGIGYFRGPISYSAWCHMLETRWLRDPSIARGCFLNFVHSQRGNGSYPGTVLHHAGVGWDFFHANWGPAIMGLDMLHPDDEFLESIYESVAKYLDYMDGERDPEKSGLYDVIDQFETGQEFMRRYTAIDPEADRGKGEARFRLKGVDATVAVYNIKRLMAYISRRLGIEGGARKWDTQAERIKQAIITRMWNPGTEMFSDAKPDTFELTNVKSLVCFQPYWGDIVDERHVAGFERHLFDPEEFWTPFPAASTSIDDEHFHPDGMWKGRRHNCPWNGRVWPMQNSFIAEALSEMAWKYDQSLKPRLAEFLRKFIRMMFHDGDIDRPNCYEHYNPITGKPCVFRGINDYQHSTVVDLIIKHIAGFKPQPDGTYKVEPLAEEFDRITLLNVPFRGRFVDIRVENGKVSVEEH